MKRRKSAGKVLQSALRQVAENHGVSLASVQQEIALALEAGRLSNDPAVQAAWAKIPRKGEVPTAEEVLLYLTWR